MMIVDLDCRYDIQKGSQDSLYIMCRRAGDLPLPPLPGASEVLEAEECNYYLAEAATRGQRQLSGVAAVFRDQVQLSNRSPGGATDE